MALVEVTRDLEEFKKLVDSSRRLRYEIDVKELLGGSVYKVTLKIYGIAKEGHVIVYEEEEIADFLKNLDRYNSGEEIVRDIVNKLAEKAKSLGAKPGRYET